jgi:hypothetical protein
MDQVGCRPRSLPQPLGQLQQVDAAQRAAGSQVQVVDTVCI